MSEPKPVAVDDPNEIAKMNQRQVKLGLLAQEVALLNDEERRSWCTWKNPPPKRTN